MQEKIKLGGKAVLRKTFVFVLMLVFLMVVASLSGCAAGTETSDDKEERDYFKVGVVTSLTGAMTYGVVNHNL